MTKRIIGLILAIAAIAVIVIAAIRHNTYTSMIGPAATEMPAPEKRGKKNGAGNSAGRFAHCGQTRHGTANGRPCRAGTVIENNLTIGIFPVRPLLPNTRVRTCNPTSARFTRKKLRSNYPGIEIPGTDSLCRGFRLEGFRCFSKTLLLLHRPASYGRIVVGVGKRISPLSLKHSALLIFLSHLLIIFVTRIVRRSRILRRDGENTAIRPVIERNFHPLYCIRTW